MTRLEKLEQAIMESEFASRIMKEVIFMRIDKNTIDLIVALHNAGKSCEEIAEMIGLSEFTVRAIVKP